MSSTFLMKALQRDVGPILKVDPIGKWTVDQLKPTNPPGPPPVPSQNDALNAALTTTDQLRMRRGMLANIYAGSQSSQPLTGKTQLGT
jgi:hypothetical protein